MSDYFDLGSYQRPVTTTSAQAETWFNRGLVWAYGFNHEEAVRCFERAIESDPDCVMAYWGVAYALGPNYNAQWDAFDRQALARAVARAHEALAQAARRDGSAQPAERALIRALSARFPAAMPPEDCAPWSAAYASAMREAYREHPDDLDVTALFADALMNLAPWALWERGTGEPSAVSCTSEARAVLERALGTDEGREHPGLLHFYIHLMEMSPYPELALPAGDLLRELVPDAGHLLHMPTHLDVLCGDYRQVVSSNARAIAADSRFLAVEGGTNVYTLYRVHNYHFKIYGAMFLGQSQVALDTADELAASIPEALLRVDRPAMADLLEGFVGMRQHVLIRFGRWQQIVDTPLPADRELYCTTTAIILYSRAVAHAASGHVRLAEETREEFRAAVARVPDSRTLFNNTCADILKIAAAMLDGEICYRKADYDAAFAHLERAVQLDDGLPYDEPWGWMQPARHAYGALLLEQGRIAEAKAVYRADLGFDTTLARSCQHPGNPWSLHGYHECLVRLGKHELAAVIASQLAIASARADVPITSSCYCRLSCHSAG
ncbi:MAG: tetratricopeptide repeat protein [Streptosporangiaceae bacterium]